MRAIEELCLENGLVRCHRSFFSNPPHIKVLRKDQELEWNLNLGMTDYSHLKNAVNLPKQKEESDES